MANLPEEAAWRPGIYQIEVTDPVIGGPDGISNIAARQLADRTAWLKESIDAAKGDFPSLSARFDAADLESPAHLLRAFGIYGDRAVDDAAAFARLDAAMRGRSVDLLGGVYRVDSTPINANYHGGSFLVDGAYVGTPARPRLSPFEGHVSIAATYPGTFWPAGVWYDETTRLLYRVEIVAERHDATSGGRVDLLCSRDQGATWADRRTIFADPDNPRPRAAAFAFMGGGRYGGVLNTGDTTRRSWFIHSDNYGVDWTIREITSHLSGAGLTTHFVYGGLMPGPSGAEGDWVVASYGGLRAARMLRTVDNGETWSAHLLRDAAGLPGGPANPTEPSLVRIPGGGWMMFVRLETSPASAQNMWASRSADGLIWEPWTDTGVLLGANPVHALYDGGQIHVLLAQRTGFAGTERPNTLFRYSLEAGALFADPAELGRRAPVRVAALPSRAIGYLQSCRLAQNPQDKHAPWLHILKSESESSTLRQTSSHVVSIQDLKGPSMAAGAAVAPLQILENPIFEHWPRGDSFTAAGEDLGTAGRWRSVRSGGAMTVERIALTPEQSRLFPFRPASGMRVALAAPEDYAGIAQVWLGEDARRILRLLLTAGRYVCRIWGVGPPPPAGLTANLSANGVSFASGVFEPVPAGQTLCWVAEAELLASAAPAGLEEVGRVQFGISGGAASMAYDATLTGVFLYPLHAAAQMDVAPPTDQRPLVERYCRRWMGVGLRLGPGGYVGGAQARIIVPVDMGHAPVVSHGALSGFSIEGVADRPIISLAATTGPKQITLSLTADSEDSGHGLLRFVDGAAWLLADTGY